MDANQFYYDVDQFFAERRLEDAEAYMKNALKEAEADGDLPGVVTVCNELGGLYRALSRYDEGIPLYEKALSVMETLGMKDTEHYATTLVNFATTYTMIGDTDRALQLYSRAAAIYGLLGLSSDYRLATLFNNMAGLYQDVEQFDLAEDCLNQAVYILQGLDDSQIDLAITYTNLAGIYLSRGQSCLDEAKVTVKKALDLFIGESGDNDVHYAAAVNVLGQIYCAEKETDKAIALFQEALQLTRRDYGDDTMSYAMICDNLALCYQMKGDSRQAETYKAKSDQIKARVGL